MTEKEDKNKAPLSDAYEKAEAKAEENAKAKELAAKTADIKKKTAYFWAPAKMFQLANYQEEEVATTGKIIKREQPIRFYEHVFSTDDQKKISFIRKSGAYEAGVIIECDSIEDATSRSLRHDFARMGTHTIEGSVNESVLVSPKDVAMPNIGADGPKEE